MIFRAVAGFAFLVFVGGAHADTLPKEILGNWCSNGERTHSGNYYTKGPPCGGLNIKSRSLEQYDEDDCKFKSITTRYETDSYWENSVLKFESVPVYEVKASCEGEGERWNATLFFTLRKLKEGGKPFFTLNYEHYTDNEVPKKYYTKFRFCKKTEPDCNNSLVFEADRVNILENGEGRGFCRYAKVNNVWDPKQVPATKTEGAVVTIVDAVCPTGVKRFELSDSKGSVYVRELR